MSVTDSSPRHTMDIKTSAINTIYTEEGRGSSNSIPVTPEYNPPSTPPASAQPSHSISPSGSRERRERQAVVTLFTWGVILKNHLKDHYKKILILFKAVSFCIFVISFSVLMLYKVLIYVKCTIYLFI